MAIPEKQKAWLYKEYGPKENLSLIDGIKVEKPAADQVLVKVHAASLNLADYKRQEGLFQASEAGPLHVPSYDVAGVVIQVGSSVTKFKVGDRVYGDINEPTLKPKRIGSLAQYVAAYEELLAVIPPSLSFTEAASLPMVLLTAYQAFKKGKLDESKTILILGRAGGVGTIAIQLAAHVFKTKVVATTASGPKVDLVKSLGATIMIDYKKESLSNHPTKYDIVFNMVGKGETLIALKKNGFAMTIANFQPAPPEVFFIVLSNGSDLENLAPYLENGGIKPIIDPTSPYKFEDVLEVFKYLEGGRAQGKVVIAMIECWMDLTSQQRGEN